MMTEYVRVPKADWLSILDATREKAGYSEPMVSGEVAGKIAGIQTGGGSGGDLFHRMDGISVNINTRVSVTAEDYTG